MSWLLNTLHADLRTSKKRSSIIHKCFQGELEVVKETQNKAIGEKKESGGEQDGTPKITDGVIENNNIATETYSMPFLMLGFARTTSFQRCDGEKYNTLGILCALWGSFFFRSWTW